MEKNNLTRKDRDRQLREDDFLNAAEKLFAERGYFHTSMEDVAQEAEYATGTIYRYFESKEDLYHRLLIRKSHAYFENNKKVLAGIETPLEKLKALIRDKVRFFTENSEFVRIYITEVNAPCDIMNPPEGLKDLHKQYMQLYRDIFEDGMKSGVFRKVNVELLLLAYEGMTNNLLCNSISSGKDISEEDIEKFILGFIEKGLITKKGRK